MSPELAQIGYLAEHHFDNVWTVRQNLRYTDLSSDITTIFPIGVSPGDPCNAGMPGFCLTRSGFFENDRVRTFMIDNQAEARFGLGPFSHTVLLGLDYQNGTWNSTSGAATGSVPAINVLDPVYGSIGDWLDDSLPYASAPDEAANVGLDHLAATARHMYPGEIIGSIFVDDDEPKVMIAMAPSWSAYNADRKSAHWIKFDAHTGKVLKQSKSFSGDGRSFFDVMLGLHQPRPFSTLAEFRKRAISTLSTIGGFPKQKDVHPATHREKGAGATARCSDVRKGIFKGGSDGRTNIRRSGSWKQDAFQICGPRLFRFAVTWTVAMV
jgi:hypothetical protein